MRRMRGNVLSGYMQTVEAIRDMQKLVCAVRRDGKRVGLVPTMGFLHEGHLSLVRLAREHADFTVASLFVNPKQFGPSEDFERYPRDQTNDIRLLEAEQVDALFCPPTEEMYAPGHQVYVTETEVSNTLEGESRPGHFQGVLTVVAKLFLAVQPDVAVFGRKDAQQLWLIRKMVRDLNFPIEIMEGPTVREPDGLAMSSRNANVTGATRKQAACLSRALRGAAQRCAKGERNAYQLRKAMMDVMVGSDEAQIDYIAIVDRETFAPITMVRGPAVALLAVRFGATRLIDNMELGADDPS